MKALAINGSPRKGWNTAQMLESALKGAEDAGCETELVHLYDVDAKGCYSCFACKRQGHESSVCRYEDALTPLLEKSLAADVLILGSPIYYRDVTGMMRCYMERLGFPTLTYDDFSRSVYAGKVDCGFIFTMNVTEERACEMYGDLFDAQTFPLSKLNGKIETLCAYNTLQFSDYSKYHAGSLDAEGKLAYRDEHFPKDLRAAYELGKRLAS